MKLAPKWEIGNEGDGAGNGIALLTVHVRAPEIVRGNIYRCITRLTLHGNYLMRKRHGSRGLHRHSSGSTASPGCPPTLQRHFYGRFSLLPLSACRSIALALALHLQSSGSAEDRSCCVLPNELETGMRVVSWSSREPRISGWDNSWAFSFLVTASAGTGPPLWDAWVGIQI